MRYYQKIFKVALDQESPFITFPNYLLSYFGIKESGSPDCQLLIILTSN